MTLMKWLFRAGYLGQEEQAWRKLSSEIGAQFVGGSGRSMTVVAQVKKWTITLAREERTSGSAYGSTTWRRMTARYVSRDAFRFEVYRRGLLSSLRRVSGLAVGYAELDRDFIIKGDDESKVRALFGSPRIRQLIQSQPSLHLEVLHADRPGRVGDGVHELWFKLGWQVITDIPRLESLFELCIETLNQLCQIGSASEDEPEGGL